MRILYMPQLTSIDKSNNKYNIGTDSNYIIMRGFVETIEKYLQYHEFKIDIIIPSFHDMNDYEILLELKKDSENIEFKFVNLYPNSFASRYDFPFREINANIDLNNYDILINNIPPLSKNFRCLQEIQNAKDLKIVSFLHFLDDLTDKVPQSISYFIRQAEGMISSDIGIFQCETNMIKFRELIHHYFHFFINNKEFMDTLNKKFKVWNCTYSQKEIERYKSNEKFDIKTIVFPNRISKTNYNHFNEFIEATNNLYKKRQDFRVVFTDPTTNLENIEFGNSKIITLGKVLNREEYISSISKCHIYVALFTNEYHGGVASRECGAAGLLPVFPNINEYSKLMPHHYPGYCKKDLSDLENKIDNVLDLLDNETYKNEYINEHSFRILKSDSFEHNKYKIFKTLENLMMEKLEEKK